MRPAVAAGLGRLFSAVAALAASAATAAVPKEVIDSFAEVRKVARHGDVLWPGFSAAPFGFLLVQESGETLICDDRVPEGFVRAGRIEALGCPWATGPKSWRQPGLLAAMPAFGPGEVIVMGTPQSTGLDEPTWRRTILHEHFHQWQGELPDIYKRIEALDLANGDQTGMWMLNYPFPYDKPAVRGSFRSAAGALVAALNAPKAELRTRTRAYLEARANLQRATGDTHWRYFDFQLWKEGVARWTELEIARRAGGSWAERSRADWEALVSELAKTDLGARKRVAVYAYGAAEAALLDRLDTDWRGCYRVVLGLTPCWDSLGPSFSRVNSLAPSGAQA